MPFTCPGSKERTVTEYLYKARMVLKAAIDQRCLLPHPLLLDLAPSGEVSPFLGKARKPGERGERVRVQYY